jgi:2-polyprenyl-6-methoxyphenol hydroxylase-like FAD-dependent oxidoreductase
MAAVMARHWDVLVVGAGPVGTLLAGALARQGASVLLLERETDIPGQTRASTLNARSMEIMSALEVPDLADWPHSMMGHYAGVPVSLAEIDSPWAGLWRMPQPDLVRLLRDWASGNGAVVRTGVTFTRAQSTQTRATQTRATQTRATQTRALSSAVLTRDAAGQIYESRFLVGADGAASAVRASLGFTPSHVTATRHMIRCDVKGVTVAPRRFEWHGNMVVTAGAISPEITRLMLFSPRYSAADKPTFGDVCRDWRDATGERVDGGECVWLDQFSNGCSTVANWDVGNVFLAGDAAHDQPPVGGSSLNAGIQDAHNLAWKLTALLSGSPGELAATYGRERAEATATMQESVREQEALIFGADRQRGQAVRDRLARSAAFRRRIARSLSGLDTHYMTSTQTGPRVSPAQLARVLGRTLLPGEGAALDQQAIIAVGDRAEDVLLVVRPDGHAAWVPGRPRAGQASVIARWFGDFLKPVVMKASARD